MGIRRINIFKKDIMSLFDQTIARRYVCQDCEFDEYITQKIVGEDFIKICPNCKSDNIYIKNTDSTFTIGIDLNTPKTVGALMDKNKSRLDKEVDPETKKGFKKGNHRRKKKKNE